jgi:hypothetical protein
MQAVRTPEESVNFYASTTPHGATSQKKVIFRIIYFVLSPSETNNFPTSRKCQLLSNLFTKKGDKSDYSNYQGISLLSTSYNILYKILLCKLIPYADEIIGTHQCGFQHERLTTDQIFHIR